MTLNEFKDSIVIGDSYEATHQYLGDNPSPERSLGVRKIGYKASTKFGFESNRTMGGISYIDFPKASELTITENGFIIEKEGFMRLTYKKVN